MTDSQICRVLGSKFDKDDFPCIQVERLGGGTNSVQLMHTAGLMHRPLDPSADGTACQAKVETDGGSFAYAQLAYEPRAQALLPAIAPGETLLYSGSGAFFRAHIDGRLSMFTTDDNTVNGRSISFTLNPTSPDPVGPDGLEYSHPHCRLTFNATGYHASHSSGARLDFGSIGGLPTPFSALASYAKLSAAMVHIDGTAVTIGPAGAVGEPPVKAISLATLVLAPVAAYLTAAQAALTALGAVTQNAAAGPAIAAAATALTAAESALTGALALMGSSSTMVV